MKRPPETISAITAPPVMRAFLSGVCFLEAGASLSSPILFAAGENQRIFLDMFADEGDEQESRVWWPKVKKRAANAEIKCNVCRESVFISLPFSFLARFSRKCGFLGR
eukprot:Sdes_comp20547_c0_seq1m15269